MRISSTCANSHGSTTVWAGPDRDASTLSGSAYGRVAAAGCSDPRGLDKGKLSSYIASMRRKPGTLLPIELSLLEAAIELRLRGTAEFYGFMIATEVSEREGARLLTAYGTLYKALSRMEKAGLVESRWEDPLVAAAGLRPRRRLYCVTAVGQAALAKSAAAGRAVKPSLRSKPAPS